MRLWAMILARTRPQRRLLPKRSPPPLRPPLGMSKCPSEGIRCEGLQFVIPYALLFVYALVSPIVVLAGGYPV